MRYAVFAKHLQGWPLDRACGEARAVGFEGLDLTVREGGYIAPADVVGALPLAVETARKAGLEVPLITTGLTGAGDAFAENILRSAGDAGVREAKLHYWPLVFGEGNQGLVRQLDGARRQLGGLAKWAEKAGVRLNIHNHSGDWVQHSAWAVRELVAEHPPEVVGVYFDPAHYVIEGGMAGWRAAMDLLAGRVTLVAVKDCRWVDGEVPDRGVGQGSKGGALGAGGGDARRLAPAQERRWVPVGSGNVRWSEVLTGLRRGGFGGAGRGWASIHGEYQGRWSYKDLTTPEVLAQCAADMAVIRGVEASLDGATEKGA